MSKVKKFSNGVIVFICVLAFILGFAGGFVGYAYFTLPDDSDVYVSGDLSFHFLELGNANTGDCTLIKVGNTEVLIDAGSKTSSIPVITAYIDGYIEDDILEYVIVTHAHEDHYAGFATNETTNSIFDFYKVGTIIDFPQITSSKSSQVMYNNYLRERQEEVDAGAKHYTALDCVNSTNGAQPTFELSSSVTMTILYHRFYEEVSTTENNHSVCTLLTQGDNNFLFTGDLEKEGEESLAASNELPHCKLYKAGHHGSKTSSHEIMLAEISPEIVCVCCCAGNVEYLTTLPQNLNNSFPTQEFIDRISVYTDKVYVTTLGYIVQEEYVEDGETKTKWVNEEDENGKDKFTSFNGNIVVTSNRKGVEVNCSNNNLILKETEWFKNNRTLPSAWAS